LNEEKSEAESYPWSAGPVYAAILDLFIEHGAYIDATGNRNYTPLSWAAECGYKMLVELLLDKGAKIEPSKDGRFCLPPLYLAAEKGHIGIVALLLERGAKVETPMSPLTPAAINGHEEVV
jgi:ankyrin repeat protein